MQNAIIKPVISEKSMNHVKKGKFTFVVARTAGKEEIKKEIENKFKVKVVSVATSITKGKTKRFGARRLETAMPSYKKVTVKLEAGQKIDLFDIGA